MRLVRKADDGTEKDFGEKIDEESKKNYERHFLGNRCDNGYSFAFQLEGYPGVGYHTYWSRDFLRQ